jgi:phosphoribosylformylglycinamidine cyclo-ligase
VSVAAEGPLTAAAYRVAGVDLGEGQRTIARIRPLARRTFTPRVESEIGAFAGFFSFPDAGSDRLLVASMDGVGTKLKLAAQTGRWRGIGYDIVSHCVNDILVHGARPVFFLDYIGAGKLSADTAAEVVEGMCEACVESGCALIGGETAEMPGMYPAGELDLVGTIVGEVARSSLVDGSAITPGDRIIALPSTGLHTNGYSLARKILGSDEDPTILEEWIVGEQATWADLLLARHRMYLGPVLPLVEAGLVRGMAHITGGGVPENLPRILPPGVRAMVRRGARPVPALFGHLIGLGSLNEEEAWLVFNMGVGFLVIAPGDRTDEAFDRLSAAGADPWEIGRIEEGPRGVGWL